MDQPLEEFQFRHLIDSILACSGTQKRAIERRENVIEKNAINDTVTKVKRRMGVGDSGSSTQSS